MTVPQHLRLALCVVILPVFFLNAKYALANDNTPPYSAIYLNPLSPDGDSGWYLQTVTANIYSQDLQSGVSTINHRLNNGLWEVKSFTNTLNLIVNPSFEDDLAGNWVKNGNLQGGVDAILSQDGNKSVFLGSDVSQLGCWSNATRYIPAAPSDTFNVSVYIKGSDVTGAGSYFNLYALTSLGSKFIGKSENLLGTFDWKIITANYGIFPDDTYGVYVDLCLEGTGRINFDSVYAASLNESGFATVPIYANGENTLEFFATDAYGNTELTKSQQVKIDARSPTGWSNFQTERGGNEHTFSSSIEVFDRESGLKSGTSKFQYSLDNGSNWGYYQDFARCKGSFLKDGWISLDSNFEDGAFSGVLNTPAIDYCNSNWNICKTVRFYIEDVSGRTSTRDICINGPWFKTSKANILAKGSISQNGSVGDATATYFIFAGGSISNATAENFSVMPYFDTNTNMSSFEDLLLSLKTVANTSKFPSTSGAFLFDGNLSISANTIPASVKDAVAFPLLFIDGDLTINSNISLNDGGGIIFIVSGEVEVDKQVSNIDSIIYSFGNFDSSYNGNSNAQTLVVNGAVISESFRLSRQTAKNTNYLGEDFIYDPTYLLKFTSVFGERKTIYKEI